MQATNYDIELGNLVTPFNDAEIITRIINTYLNADEELFNVAFKSNNEAFEKENLVFDTQVQGVLQLKNVSMSNTNDGTELKEFSINLMLPLNENNNIYNNAILKFIKNVNNQQFDIDDSVSLSFRNIQMIDANMLPKPINGIEYEMVIVTGSIVTSKQFLQAVDQYIKINGMKLCGVINIGYTCLKTTDPDVFGLKSPIQKNTVNGIQIAIDVDIQVYKDDIVHYALFNNAESKQEYTIEYYNGLFSKEYKMILLQAIIAGITGDSVKGKLSFVMGE